MSDATSERAAEKLEIDPRATALVVVDLQKGIVARPAEPRPPAEVVRNAARLADAWRSHGGFVVLVRVAFAPNLADAVRPDADDPRFVRREPPPADFSELVPEIGPRPGDHVVVKRQWGAFYGTDLDLQLRRRGIRRLVLCGIATCYGVESTARDAYERGYHLVFAEDAMTDLAAASHEHAVTRIFPRIGRVRRTDQVLDALQP
jgi:nicotinamidase-related amidase